MSPITGIPARAGKAHVPFREKSLGQLTHVTERLAQRQCRGSSKGHFTVYRFTCGWKAVLGTPWLSFNDELLINIQSSRTQEEALRDLLLRACNTLQISPEELDQI